MRLLLGICKGLVVGGALGFAAQRMGIASGSLAFILFAAIGFASGVVAGKPIWRQETLWTPVIKGLFGAAILSLLYWGARTFIGWLPVPAIAALHLDGGATLGSSPVLLGPALSILYSVFVEIDDGGSDGNEKPAKRAESKR
ncbi:MAG: hypothetical protein SGI86_22220 [Deltaproteobacteria bacterium]|nr:hypothetical protein [Deltaproteobacteria bacterium]